MQEPVSLPVRTAAVAGLAGAPLLLGLLLGLAPAILDHLGLLPT
jgi:hypothetical protein